MSTFSADFQQSAHILRTRQTYILGYDGSRHMSARFQFVVSIILFMQLCHLTFFPRIGPGLFNDINSDPAKSRWIIADERESMLILHVHYTCAIPRKTDVVCYLYKISAMVEHLPCARRRGDAALLIEGCIHICFIMQR